MLFAAELWAAEIMAAYGASLSASKIRIGRRPFDYPLRSGADIMREGEEAASRATWGFGLVIFGIYFTALITWWLM